MQTLLSFVVADCIGLGSSRRSSCKNDNVQIPSAVDIHTIRNNPQQDCLRIILTDLLLVVAPLCALVLFVKTEQGHQSAIDRSIDVGFVPYHVRTERVSGEGKLHFAF